MKLPPETRELEAALRRHNRLYFEEARPEISDDEYDRLVERLKHARPDSPLLAEIGAGRPLADQDAWTHSSPMLSLDKCYDEETLLKWAEKWSGQAVETPKVDGVAGTFIYGPDGKLSVAATRGDGTEGEIATAQMATVAGVPDQVSQPGLEVRGEIYMPLSVFERFADRFANPRNTTAGGIKQKDPEKTRSYALRFFAYDVLGTGLGTEREKLAFLEAEGFEPAPYVLREKGELQAGYEAWERRRDSLDYEIDGVVFKIDDVAQQSAMGATAHHPRYAIAYKLKTESRVARLEEVIWSVSRTGALTPVARIEPTNLSGVTVSRVSLHNLGMVRKLGLTSACSVRVTRRGGVIPYVEEVVASLGEIVQPPERCPSCGSAPEEDGDFLLCPVLDCRDRRLGVLEHYAKVVGADGFGPAVLEQAYDRGFLREVDDFYGLQVGALAALERMGPKSAQNLVEQVDGCRQQSLKVFLVSLAIPEVGPTVAAVLDARYGTLEALQAAAEEELAEIHGIGEVIARHVVAQLAQQEARIERLLVQIRIKPPQAEGEESAGPLVGLSFVFTGKMETGDRKSAQARARALGASTPPSVTKDLSYLVVGDEGSPLFGGGKKGSKIKKAEKYAEAGAPLKVISETDFLELVGQAEADGP